METNTITKKQERQLGEMMTLLEKLKMPCNLMWAEDPVAAEEQDLDDPWFLHIDGGQDVDFSEELWDKCNTVVPNILVGWVSRPDDKFHQVLGGPAIFDVMYRDTYTDRHQHIGIKEESLYGDHRIKVVIRCDSVGSQSYAHLKRWDGSQWQYVESIHWTRMQSKYSPKYTQGSKPPHVPVDMFAYDTHVLKTRAVRILS